MPYRIEIVEFSHKAQNDLKLWQDSGNKNIIKKISELIHSIQDNPYSGIGAGSIKL